MPKTKQKPVEIYKIIEGPKTRFYESKAQFEKQWKYHSKSTYRFSELIGYKLVKMAWRKVATLPPNMIFNQLPPRSYPVTLPLIPAVSLFQRRVLK